MKILHIITGLKKAGAEKNLFNLATKDKKNTHIIISLTGLNFYGNALKKKKIKIYALRLKQNLSDFKRIYSLYKIIRSNKPDIIQTWMYYADIIGGVISKLAGIKKIFWNLRSDGLDLRREHIKIIPFYLTYTFLSIIIPKKIIANSRRGILKHQFVFNKKKFYQINNGFEIPNESKINIKKNNNFTIGHFGRFHPLKNHEMIINIAKKLNKKKKNIFFILGGLNVDKNNKFFKEKLKNENLKNKILLVGEIKKMNDYYKKVDCVVSTSLAEGFPNILAEAMSNGTICLSTNVGETNKIVENSSRIFKNETDLIQKILKLKKIKDNDYKNWLEIKNKCRDHIKKNFTIKKMINEYNKVWCSK